MLVPREDRLNRFYIQLSQEGQTYDRTKVTPKTMLRIAQGIMKPYKIDYRYCDWWSLYQVGLDPQHRACTVLTLSDWTTRCARIQC